jgi:hypothetical protein
MSSEEDATALMKSRAAGAWRGRETRGEASPDLADSREWCADDERQQSPPGRYMKGVASWERTSAGFLFLRHQWRCDWMTSRSSAEALCEVFSSREVWASVSRVKAGERRKAVTPVEASEIKDTQRSILSSRQDMAIGKMLLLLGPNITVRRPWGQGEGTIVMQRGEHATLFWKKEIARGVSTRLAKIPEQSLRVGRQRGRGGERERSCESTRERRTGCTLFSSKEGERRVEGSVAAMSQEVRGTGPDLSG